MTVSKVQTNRHLLRMLWELINNTPFLEYCAFCHVRPSSHYHESIFLWAGSLHVSHLLQELVRKVFNVIKVRCVDVEHIRMIRNLNWNTIKLY